VTSCDIRGGRSGTVAGFSLSLLCLLLLLRFILEHCQDPDSAASNDTIADNSNECQRKQL
jgi:hypothetical protein